VKADAETIPALLALRATTDPELRALVADGESITYAELDESTKGYAARFAAAGVAKGDRVGLLAPNSVEWAVIAYAVMRTGAVLVPLSTLLRPPELRAQLDTAEVSHLVAVPEFRGRRYLEDLDAPTLRAVWRTDEIPERSATIDVQVEPHDDMVVLFTSGSSGTPKGVIHSHGGAIRATAAGLAARCIRPKERLYVPMPFFWTGGLGTGLLSTLIAGATLFTEAEPEPARTLDLLERERVTLFRGWPDQAAKVAAHPAFAGADLSSLGDGSLAALLPPDRRPPPGARPNIFGMTETFGPYCGDRLDVDMPRDKWGSCGRPFDGVEVRIAENGEIWLRGPNLLRGVCGRPLSTVFTPDCWFPTGDKGRLDGDGYLWYEGRLDDMFKVKGASVYPSEVEVALRAVDGVRQAYVTEVDAEVGALVVSDEPVEALRAAVKERLSGFKVPTRWLVTADAASIPMTATGKVDKQALRALLTEEGT
jgi:acyl-CoA synthetase (AMP-forming)/AMP-acid ligase II